MVKTKFLNNFDTSLKGFCHCQKCLHLFADSEAYHEQMGSIPSSNGSLDIALSNAHTLVIRFQFISIWAIVIQVTDICFVEKDHSLALQ